MSNQPETDPSISTQVPQSTTASQPIQPSRPSRVPMSSIIIFLLAAIAIGSAGFLLGKFNAQQRTTTSPSSNPSPSTIASLNPIANWKTYTNTEWEFSIKYPEFLGPPAIVDQDKSSLIFFHEDKINPANTISIGIYLGELNSKKLEDIAYLNNPDPELGEILEPTKRITVGQLSGYSYKVLQHNRQLTYIFILANDKTKYFEITVENIENDTTHQILSTFRLLDNNVLDGKCYYDGKTYTIGDSFPKGDGCNTCICTEDQIGCTEKNCPSN